MATLDQEANVMVDLLYRHLLPSVERPREDLPHTLLFGLQFIKHFCTQLTKEYSLLNKRVEVMVFL